jgi:hypothetical protein
MYSSERVYQISLDIPENSDFINLLNQLKYFQKNNNSYIFNYANIKPQTVINVIDRYLPQISFNTNTANNHKFWLAGNLRFGFNLDKSLTIASGEKYYSELLMGKEIIKFVELKSVLKMLAGKLKSINHCGINFGPKLLINSEYYSFRDELAKTTNLYSYPTGEEWPFLIPSSDEEYLNNINNETIERNPKFEIVYSRFHLDPVIQMDIDTTLDRNTAQELFPSPYGISFVGLENVIRSIFIKNNWNGIIFRLDLRFRSTEKDFGYWIVKQGKRY